MTTNIGDSMLPRINCNTDYPQTQTLYARDGSVKATQILDHYDNYYYLIGQLGWDVKYNQVMNQVEINGAARIDKHDHAFFAQAKRDGWKPHRDTYEALLGDLAEHNAYHPYKMFFEAEAWDGNDYISQLFDTLHFQDHITDEELVLYKRYLTSWLVGMVRKVYDPEQQNSVLTFVGPQRKGKSTWFIHTFGQVGRGAVQESKVTTDNKDHSIRRSKHLVWSIPEIDGVTRKNDAADLKAFLTEPPGLTRLPYARNDIYLENICSFSATTNQDEFLRDFTGNDRYMVMAIESADCYHDVNMEQLFAQCLLMYREGYGVTLTREEQILRSTFNQQYETKTLEDQLADEAVPGNEWMSAADVVKMLRPNIPEKEVFSMACKLGARLKRNGFEVRKLHGKTMYKVQPLNQRTVTIETNFKGTN